MGEYRFNLGDFGHRAPLGRSLSEAIAVKHRSVRVAVLILHDSTHWDAGNMADSHGETVTKSGRGDCLAA